MPRRHILTKRQRAVLFDLPTEESVMLRHYTLADDDIDYIQARRRAHNRFGFALQLCALRFPGRLLAPGEVISQEISRFLAAQLGLKPDDLMGYAAREETRHEHLAALRQIYGYRMFSGHRARTLKSWLAGEAETAISNEYLARRFVEECRRTMTILPGISTIERLCANALVAAERRVETRIVDRLNDVIKDQLDALLPATVSEAPYILDGLLMNETGRNIREQYADTGGFTDHVFAVTALLNYRFIPRIRDLPSKRLYIFDPNGVPKELKGLIGGKIREGTITTNWPDVLRSAATMVAGIMPPSQLLKKFASHPRQHDLAIALREIGRVERTLFIIDWLLDADMQRRAQIGLNKGESHHALKNALRIGRQGEIRDRTAEGQHYRMAGLNLLAAIIIYWNTDQLGKAVAQRKRAGLDCSPDLLPQISPLGWAHILITGEYRWSKRWDDCQKCFCLFER